LIVLLWLFADGGKMPMDSGRSFRLYDDPSDHVPSRHRTPLPMMKEL